MTSNRSLVTVIIVVAQFLGTSLWFVGNISIPQIPLPDLASTAAIGAALSAVQLGFIGGTLIFAFLALADRFSPSKVFFVSAICGALANAALLLPKINIELILASRFITGFFLAGIYPVGMKIASDYYEKGLGKVLGYLVGALVLGTALPHFINSLGVDFSYRFLTLTTSFLAILGGFLILIVVPDGPFRKRQQKIKLKAIPELFKVEGFRKAAFGYFGHMWELYAFWGFLPVFIQFYADFSNIEINIPLWSFMIIATGAVSCALGGHISFYKGSKAVALMSLIISGLLCFCSPFLLHLPKVIFLISLIIWGAAVVADSPQFSTLVAQNSLAEYRGTALTFVNCIGFGITIFSIQAFTLWSQHVDPQYIFLILGAGPIFGILSLLSSKKKTSIHNE
ncbi:nitrate/nitrite transporter [Leeuwenhoekiella sp. A16]|uniref:MFS transporter n=1 Tax=unclassified Leeuwenhoekiella TaxID=2615029 RepID=UPI003A80778D